VKIGAVLRQAQLFRYSLRGAILPRRAGQGGGSDYRDAAKSGEATNSVF